jgi:hypothetical protein
VEPALAGDVVTRTVEVFVDHVREVATEAVEFLFDTSDCLDEELLVTLVPQFVAVGECGRDAWAGGLDDMLVDGVGIEGREVPMPEDAGGRWDHETDEARHWPTPVASLAV